MNKKVFIAVLSLLSVAFTSTPSAFAVPSAPGGISMSNASPSNTSPSTSSVTVKWNGSTVDQSHNYAISYTVSASATGQITRTVTIPSVFTQTNFQALVSSLAGGVTYSFTVTALDSIGATTPSAPVNFLTQSVPSAPTVNNSVVAPGQVTLTWSAPANTGGLSLDNYIISSTNLATPIVIPSSATSKVITGLSAGSTYVFQITANNGIGASAAGIFGSVTLPNTPDAPAAPNATVTGTSISVNWTAPVSNGGSAITGYTVYLVNSSSVDVTSKIVSGQTTATFSGVAVGTYTVKVLATNIVGSSPRSLASTVQTVAAPISLLANNPTLTPSTFPDLLIGGSRDVSAVAPSGQTVTFSVSATPLGSCTFTAGSGNTGTIRGVAAGTCTISGLSDRTTSYAAGLVSKTFNITTTPQMITFATITTQTMPGPLTISATASSALDVAFAVSGNCTISGVTVSYTGVGGCTISATQAGNGIFAAATSVTRTFTIIKQSQAISFATIGTQQLPRSINLSATASSNLPVAYSAVGECSSSGTTLTLLRAGSCTVTASQIGNETFAPATNLVQIFTINAATTTTTPTPAVPSTPTPTPTATPTPTPTPTGTSTPTPTPTATPTPTPTATVTPSAKPITNSYFSTVMKTSNLQKITQSTSTTLTLLKLNKPSELSVSHLTKNATASISIFLPNGKTIKFPSQKISATGGLKLPPIDFSKVGIYKFSITIGTKTTSVPVKVAK